MVAAAVERVGVAYEVDVAPLPEPVDVDREMWEQVVLNLLSNAVKFTFEGRIGIGLRHEERAAVLTVTDTGTGIPADEMPRLFERFHRIENVRARSTEGSGIGLALVRELIGLHGGTIGAESVEGAGTDAAQVGLELGEGHLDRVEVGRVGRQVAERRPGRLDRFADARDLVAAQVVQHQHIAGAGIGIALEPLRIEHADRGDVLFPAEPNRRLDRRAAAALFTAEPGASPGAGPGVGPHADTGAEPSARPGKR